MTHSRLLDAIERIGNRLPHPVSLFVMALLAVMLVSALAAGLGWQVVRPGAEGEFIAARSLLGADGLWWLLSHLVENFVTFAPLGVVLVAMLGIGIAERSGLLAAVLTRAARALRGPWLTPMVVLLGVLSSIGFDAGYVVLLPIAAVLYAAAGRSPLTGIAAAFAGVSGGYSANLVPTAVDALLMGFTEAGARFIAPGYQVAVTANLWLMMVSTVMLTLVGWAVTQWWVEPRMARAGLAAAEQATPAAEAPAALRAAAVALLLVLAILLLAALWPGGPLHGAGNRFPRWAEAMIPLIFIVFVVPGLVYGWRAGTFASDRDVAQAFAATIAGLGSYIVLAFFAAQFVQAFNHSRLGEMLAVSGGAWLATLQIHATVLMLLFIGLTLLVNLFIGSASAKYAFFAPVFVPMFMQIGISPELTQAAYRIGDSVTNPISPLNPYMVIILALVQRYAPQSGIGTVVAMMLPYSLSFALTWAGLLVLWILAGVPLGPGGGLTYP